MTNTLPQPTRILKMHNSSEDSKSTSTLRPCLIEFLLLTRLPRLVFGPVDFCALRRLARVLGRLNINSKGLIFKIGQLKIHALDYSGLKVYRIDTLLKVSHCLILAMNQLICHLKVLGCILKTTRRRSGIVNSPFFNKSSIHFFIILISVTSKIILKSARHLMIIISLNIAIALANILAMASCRSSSLSTVCRLIHQRHSFN